MILSRSDAIEPRGCAQHTLAHRHDLLCDQNQLLTVHLDTGIEAVRKSAGFRRLKRRHHYCIQ